MLPMSFKFRANSHVKTIISKTQENSRLKTRYLKEITTKQLFIISIARDYPQSPFIQLLKIENQTHTFYFVFIFFISHLTNIYKTKINFYFAFSYASFFNQYIANSKGKEILSQIHGDGFPLSWMLWSNVEVE